MWFVALENVRLYSMLPVYGRQKRFVAACEA